MGTDLNRLLERLRPGDIAPTRRGVSNNVRRIMIKCHYKLNEHPEIRVGLILYICKYLFVKKI
jgi:hypothetical protein